MGALGGRPGARRQPFAAGLDADVPGGDLGFGYRLAEAGAVGGRALAARYSADLPAIGGPRQPLIGSVVEEVKVGFEDAESAVP